MRLIRLSVILAILLIGCLPAAAQGCGQSNPNCIVPTAPIGTNNNQAASTAFVQQSKPAINVTDAPYSAVGDGATDDTAAIQSAINALPTTGGFVDFPQPSVCYKTTTALVIGNGNSTPTNSTRQGIVLRGIGNPTITTTTGFSTSVGPRICGPGGAGFLILVSGPIQGWGVQNLVLDCGSVASTTGISAKAAVYGDSSDLTILNCAIGIATSSYPNRGSLHNSWRNVFIQVPTINFAIGVFADGDGVGTTSNTAFDHYENLTIYLPATLTTFGVDLKAVDSMQFFNTHIAGGSASAVGVQFDYGGTGVSGQWPASNMFYGLEPGETGTSVGNASTPGTGAKPNIIYGYEETNGAVVPVLNNLAVYAANAIVTNPGGNNASTSLLAAWTAFTMNPVCGTASITPNAARSKTIGKLTSVLMEFTITAIGTCGSSLTITLPNTANSNTIINGRELVSETMVACRTTTAPTATLSCLKNGFGAYLVNDVVLVEGIYENQ